MFTHHAFNHTGRDPLQVTVFVVRERNKLAIVQLPVLLRQLVVFLTNGVDGIGEREVAPGTVLEAQVPVLEPLPEHLKPKSSSCYRVLKEQPLVNLETQELKFNSYLSVIYRVQVVVAKLVLHQDPRHSRPTTFSG